MHGRKKYNNKKSTSPLLFKNNKNMLKRKRSIRIFNQLIKNKLGSDSKRSQSEVVSTVLLVLLVIAASVFLIAFVVPLVKQLLEGSKCNDYMGKITIANDEKYTCYDNIGKRLLLRVKLDSSIGTLAETIKGLRIILETSGSDSKSFEIIPPSSNPQMSVVMNNGELALAIPGLIRNEITYNISNINLRPNATLIYPILNGSQTCANAAYTLNYVPYCK